MDDISTVILVRELDKRIHMYRMQQKHGQLPEDTFLEEMCYVNEQSVVDLDNALSKVLEYHAEHIMLRHLAQVSENLVEFKAFIDRGVKKRERRN